eukprot:CAMPEP_0185161522 /NCGR_PEP_ID=MMETSP1139-20130426/5135_1 /TAXON_ID=298111 /ORGANISM="Pavlova sp., Strain CCMP459" /LENGTH=350 /DNA_ID=CAMNT_0027726793 /DNA_START=11 /DNA_END=1063 /DNA_ORIENTATION=-
MTSVPLGLVVMGEEDMNASGEQAPLERRNSFNLSDTGTFQGSDFKIARDGLANKGAASSKLNGVKMQLEELEFLEDLGQGASGIVRRARHTPTGTIVAVKTVNITDKSKRTQMVNELKSLTKATCPYMVGLYDAFYEEMQVHMVLEFMDGGDLSDFVKKHVEKTGGGITDEEALYKIAHQVLSGLNYLHRQRHQVHRDLKPANLMLTTDGLVKISDFGISSELDSTMGMCNTFVGTANYMSPERLSAAEYNFPSDIWSFGLIMLELILGKYPYPNATNYFQLLSNITDGDVPTVPDELKLSKEVRDFVSQCLSKDPAKRPTAAELMEHPWMKHYDADEMDLSMKLEDIKL